MVCSVACYWAVIGIMAPIAARGAPIATTSRLTAIRITAVAVRPIRVVFLWVGTITAEHIGLGGYWLHYKRSTMVTAKYTT